MQRKINICTVRISLRSFRSCRGKTFFSMKRGLPEELLYFAYEIHKKKYKLAAVK